MPPDLSLVIPIYNEEKNIPTLWNEIREVMARIPLSHEVIFVDDGSNDGSVKELKNLDGAVCIFSKRHRGKSSALSAGFQKSQGKIVLTLDGDLQDDPHEIPKFLQKINAGYDLVSGWKLHRKDPWTKTWPSRLFNQATSFFTGVKLHDFSSGFKAYRREVLPVLCLRRGLHRYLPLFAAAHGYHVGEIRYHHRPRRHGRSKYGISRLWEGPWGLILALWLTRKIIPIRKRSKETG